MSPSMLRIVGNPRGAANCSVQSEQTVTAAQVEALPQYTEKRDSRLMYDGHYLAIDEQVRGSPWPQKSNLPAVTVLGGNADALFRKMIPDAFALPVREPNHPPFIADRQQPIILRWVPETRLRS